jgi:hypothetical protein
MAKVRDLVKKGSEETQNEEFIKVSSNTIIPEPELAKDELAKDEPIMDEIENLELTDDILEINFDVDEIENSETIHLKEKTEVYYQMYREARQKAKLAKSLALSSYLEARRIKNLYMLEDIDDSDESDLEDLEN